MKAPMSYGKAGLDLTLPEGRRVEVLRARPQPAVADPFEAARTALARPIGSAPLAEIARGRRDACIVISDITRPAPNRVMLSAILETLEAAGIPRAKIVILIATGIHRPNEGDELIELVGPEIAARYRCVNHFSQREGECRLIGHTKSGIPVHINRRYLDADLKILTGLIEPHFWAGFSGGRKAILPGIASVETMRSMHSAAMIDACMANCGILEGNVFHLAGLEVAAMAGVDFIVNATVDEARRVTGIFAGDCDQAHRVGAKVCEAASAIELDEPADLAIVSNGGYPLDKTLYQAPKGMTTAWMALREGGRQLLVAECEEGMGSAHFVELMDMAESPAHLLELLARPDFFLVDQWGAQVIARILLENRVAIHTAGIEPARLRRFGFEVAEDAQAWLDATLAELPPEARIVVIPDGPYVYARAPRTAEA